MTIMKKLILLFTVAAIGMVTGCDPVSNSWEWWIKNDTGQTLKLTYFNSLSRVPAYVTGTLSPSDSIVLFKGNVEKAHFDNYFGISAEQSGDDVYWQIRSEDDEVLRTWYYSEINLPDQRFFDETFWIFEKRPSHQAFISAEYSWTFEISPEDIQSTY